MYLVPTSISLIYSKIITFCCQELANVTALLYTNYRNNPQMLSSRFLNSDSFLVSASLVYILHDDLLWELFFFGELIKLHPTSRFLLFQVQSMLAFYLWSSVHTLLSVENILREGVLFPFSNSCHKVRLSRMHLFHNLVMT